MGVVVHTDRGSVYEVHRAVVGLIPEFAVFWKNGEIEGSHRNRMFTLVFS